MQLRDPGNRLLIEWADSNRIKAIQRALRTLGQDIIVDGNISPKMISVINSIDNHLLWKKIWKIEHPYRFDKNLSRYILMLKNYGNRLLVEWANRERIRLIQRAINSLGGVVSVDGVFGANTARAINAIDNNTLYSKILELEHPELREKMETNSSTKSAGIIYRSVSSNSSLFKMILRLKNPGTRLLVEWANREQIELIQIALIQMGKSVVADGIFTEQTMWAIKSVNNRLLWKKIWEFEHPQELSIKSIYLLVLNDYCSRLLIEWGDSNRIKFIQWALNTLGRQIAIDGVFTPEMARAINSVDARALHQTIWELEHRVELPESSSNNKSDIPNWLKIAIGELGVREIHGRRDNPRVLEYLHSATDSSWVEHDETPWCAGFVSWVMRKAGYGSEIPRYSLRAKSWLKFGKSAHYPVLGAIAVKSRRGGGHVGFVVGRDVRRHKLYILGGNQSDKVCVKEYPESVWLDFRIPKNYTPKSYKLTPWRGVATLAGSES